MAEARLGKAIMEAALAAEAGEILARLDVERSELEMLCRANGIVRLDAFGSAVRADFDPRTSDIDLVVHFEAPSCGAYAERYFAIKEGLEHLTGKKVDLLTEGSVTNPYLRRRIDTEKVALFAA